MMKVMIWLLGFFFVLIIIGKVCSDQNTLDKKNKEKTVSLSDEDINSRVRICYTVQ